MNAKPPQKYLDLKKLSFIVEDICSDIQLQGYGFEPGVHFDSSDLS